MTAALFDTLKLSRQLRERAHFDQEQAEDARCFGKTPMQVFLDAMRSQSEDVRH